MKSIKISDEAYVFLKAKAKEEYRTMSATLNLFIKLFVEAEKCKKN